MGELDIIIKSIKYEAFMTQDDNRSFIHIVRDFFGRQKIIEKIPFTETSVTTYPITFKVGPFGHYLYLPENTAAIITTPAGNRQVYTQGGGIDLPMGAYTVQYIDLSWRKFTFSKIAANTLNAPNSGSEISLTASIIYKINNPSLLLENPNPLDAFFNTCAGAIKNFIITHRYDELIGKHEDESFISDNQVIQYIKEQVAFTDSCNAFWVRDVKIIERLGNQEINKLRHERLVQSDQSLTQKEKAIQQQDIAKEELILAETKAEQDRIVGELKALKEANQSEILKQARILDVRLDIMRRSPDLQQVQTLKIIETKKQAIEALIELYTMSGFPRDANDYQRMEKILNSLADTQINIPELSLEESSSVNDLSSTIINLISPKNKS